MMKKFYALIYVLPLLFSASMVEANSPNEYAYGTTVVINDPQSMFSQINLEQQTYLQTLSPQLNDVRIFNRNGQTVPFTLVNIYDEQPETQQFAMTLYPLDVKNTNNNGKERIQLTIQGQDVNIDLSKNEIGNATYTASYLLQVPNNIELDDAIFSLKLQFAKQDSNWQATANVLYSRDLTYWLSASKNIPLMTLTSDNGETLKLDDIVFSNDYVYKNLIINLQSQAPLPKLEQVQGAIQSNKVNAALVVVPFATEKDTNNSVIYSLNSPQPINKLQVKLAKSSSVLPVTLYYKERLSDEKWIKLSQQIIRQVNYYDDGTFINLHNKLVQAVKIESQNNIMDETPIVTAYRSQVNMIFNSANNGPFILAWGSSNANAVALDPTQLLQGIAIRDIPMAHYGEPVILAGEAALTSNAPEASSFPIWIIWIALIAGAVILILLALKLIKDVKRTQ